MTGNVTTSEVNVYVALRTAEEQVPYGKLVDTTEFLMP